MKHANQPPPASRAYDKWVKVWPGVASTRTRIQSLTSITFPSATPDWSKATWSAELT